MKVEPLPQATVGEIIGLLEFLSDISSKKEDLYELAADLKMDLDEFSAIVDASEMLGFVKIDQGDLLLTQLGSDFVNSDINARKQLFKQQLKKIKVFRDILSLLKTTGKNMIDREVCLEELSTHIPPEYAEKLLNVAIDWGRFAELIGYSADEEEIYIDEE